MDEHVGALGQPRGRGRVAHVAAQLLDRALELGVVERREVERAHLVPVGQQPAREMEPEEAGPAGDRPAHRGRTLRARHEPGPLVAGRSRLRRGLAGRTHAGSRRARREPADRGSPGRPARIRALQRPGRRDRGAQDGWRDEGVPAARRARRGRPCRASHPPRARAARGAGLRPAHTAPRAVRLGRLGAAVHAGATRRARACLRLLRRRHRAGAAPLPAREATCRRRHRRAGHAENARPRHPRRAAGPPRARPRRRACARC